MDSSSTMTKFAIYWKSDTGATGTKFAIYWKSDTGATGNGTHAFHNECLIMEVIKYLNKTYPTITHYAKEVSEDTPLLNIIKN